MGATADLERGAREWSKRCKDEHGTDKIRVARIDVVATVLERDELQWLDLTIRRPTVVANVEGAARFGGHGEADELRVWWKARTPDGQRAPRVDGEAG